MLVLTRFDFKSDLKTIGRTETIMNIDGRYPGVIAWILKKLKVDTGYSLELNSLQFKIFKRSFISNANLNIPLTQVASFASGAGRNVYYLLLTFVFFMGAFFNALKIIPYAADLIMNGQHFLMLIGVMALFIINVAICYYFFTYSKYMFYRIVTSGGEQILIAFKRSVIENIEVDEDRLNETCALVNNVIFHRQMKT